MLCVAIVIGAAVAAILLGMRWLFKGGFWEGKHSARGKTIIVTGANSGIGRALTGELCLRGVDAIVMACRSQERAERAKEELVALGADAARITIELIDLARFATVAAFVERVAKKCPHVDVLVCNAGVMSGDEPTEDGNENILQTNYLGHYLLVERLRKAVDLKRIVFTSSLVHNYAIREDLTVPVKPWALHMDQYSRAKLAEVAFAKHLSSLGVEAVSCNPGVVHTNILAGTSLEVFQTYLAPFMAFTMKTAIEGAQTPLMLALIPSDELTPGAYYSDCTIVPNHSLVGDAAKVKKMYDQSAHLCRNFM